MNRHSERKRKLAEMLGLTLLSAVVVLIPLQASAGLAEKRSNEGQREEIIELLHPEPDGEVPRVSMLALKPIDRDLFPEEYSFEEFEDEFARYEKPIADPLKWVNKSFGVFNDKLLLWVLSPVSDVYGFVVIKPIRLGLRNVVTNLGFPKRFFNTLLQGRPGHSCVEFGRFGVNLTLGLAGVWDPATKLFNMGFYEEDFDQTLGVWGIGQGIYLCLPITGPSSLRSTIALPLDIALDYPSYTAPNYINEASLGKIDEYREMKERVLDPYSAFRDFYVQDRKQKVEQRD